jgi:hypothetical protein
MAIRIRTTEKHPHPIWEKFISEYKVSEIQGFIFQCTDEELIAAAKNGNQIIPIHCLEAAEYDDNKEFFPENFFSSSEWINKINTTRYFNSNLKFLTHKPNDEYLFRLHNVELISGNVLFNEIECFKDEESFIQWWKSIKILRQTKRTVEAKSRQSKTIFDNIIEKNGSAWGGNVDGFLLSDDTKIVKAIIEIRQSRSFPVEKYDPANYFLGTATKGGDFKTWLPLIYLKNAYKIPLIILTLSTKNNTKFGYTEVFSISNKELIYVDRIPPTKNVTDDFEKFKQWLLNLINKVS